MANPVSSDKVFYLWIIYLLDVYNKIQVGVELLPLVLCSRQPNMTEDREGQEDKEEKQRDLLSGDD